MKRIDRLFGRFNPYNDGVHNIDTNDNNDDDIIVPGKVKWGETRTQKLFDSIGLIREEDDDDTEDEEETPEGGDDDDDDDSSDSDKTPVSDRYKVGDKDDKDDDEDDDDDSMSAKGPGPIVDEVISYLARNKYYKVSIHNEHEDVIVIEDEKNKVSFQVKVEPFEG